MRILAVSRKSRAHGLGGLEDHLHTVMEGLAARGHDVVVVTARHPSGATSEIVNGVRWIYVDSGPTSLDPAWWSGSRTTVAELLASESFDVIHSQSSSALPLLKEPIAGLPPVVLSLHGQYVSIVKAAVLTASIRPTPRVVARTIRDLARLTRLHLRHGNARAFRACEATVPSATERRPSSLAMGIALEQIHVARSGIDTELFRPRDRDAARRELGLPPAVPIAMCAGRLDRGKGMQYAIEALARLPEFPTATLVLVGDGDGHDSLARLAREKGVGSRVLFVGRQPLELVARYMTASDVVLFPSVLGEAGPLVVAQAMASGRPTVAFRRGAVPEMLGTDERAGLIVPAGRVKPLAAAIGRLFGDAELRDAMGAHARAKAEREMTIQNMIDRTYDAYEAAVRRQNGVAVAVPSASAPSQPAG